MSYFQKLPCENKAKGILLLCGCTHLHGKEVGATSLPFDVMSARAWSEADTCTQLADNLQNKYAPITIVKCLSLLI